MRIRPKKMYEMFIKKGNKVKNRRTRRDLK